MKYIDAEKLIAEIERRKGLLTRGACAAQIEMETNCKDEAYNEVLSFITYLQQEQPDKYETALEKAREWMPNVNQGGHAMLISIFPELGEGLDPRYGGRKQEQPEVDLEKEIESYLDGFIKTPTRTYFRDAICHFYELGKARKEE